MAFGQNRKSPFLFNFNSFSGIRFTTQVLIIIIIGHFHHALLNRIVHPRKGDNLCSAITPVSNFWVSRDEMDARKLHRFATRPAFTFFFFMTIPPVHFFYPKKKNVNSTGSFFSMPCYGSRTRIFQFSHVETHATPLQPSTVLSVSISKHQWLL